METLRDFQINHWFHNFGDVIFFAVFKTDFTIISMSSVLINLLENKILKAK